MKKAVSKMIVIVLLVALIVPLLPIRTEAAGNTMKTATKVNFGKRYKGYLSYDDDSYYDGNGDWYKIVLPSSGKLTIKLQAELNWTHYVLYNDECTKTILDEDETWNYVTKVCNQKYTKALVGGTYYLYVSVVAEDCQGDYNIAFSFEASGESFVETQNKNDGTRQTANRIKLAKAYKGFSAYNDDDYDFYKFTIGTTADVQIKIKSEQYSLIYGLYNANGSLVEEEDDVHRNGTTKISNYNHTIRLKKGTYYFVVYNYEDDCGWYKFKISIKPKWIKVSSKWKYLKQDGTYAKNQWVKNKGKIYHVNKKGFMQTGWLKLNGKKYYLDPKTGARQKANSWRTIKGKRYHFGKGGVCLN